MFPQSFYRIFSLFQNFPIPKVYYTEYDDTSNVYILITEFGDNIGEWPFKEPQIRLCGILLARIHSYFYDKINTLPDMFFQNSYYQSRYKFRDDTVSFLNSLEDNDIKIIEKLVPNIHSLRSAIESLDNEFFIIEPYTDWALIHGSFHPPEIVSKKGKGEKVPLCVDLESSRVGHPAEDIIGITGQLANWGEPHFYDLMIESYLKEMRNHQIIIDKQALEKEIIIENIIRKVKNLPFLWSRYLKYKDNNNFSSWIGWYEESIPKTTNEFLSDILNRRWTH